MEIKSVTFVGQGVLGTLFGKIIIDHLGKDTVRFVANKERIASYQKDGVYSNGGKCDFQYVDEENQGDPADLVIFTVKFMQLEDAIQIVM